MAERFTVAEILPSDKDFEKLLKAKIAFEAHQKTSDRDNWNKNNFKSTPWGIAYLVSQARFAKSKSSSKAPASTAVCYFFVAVMIEWADLVAQLKRTLKNYGYTAEDMHYFAEILPIDKAVETLNKVLMSLDVDALAEQFMLLDANKLTEAIEKHSTLNDKLFTKNGELKGKVRAKMLEIVDEFLANLKEQNIKIKVDDILFIGSNASYNYTKNSDIDLHILANTKAADYDPDIAAALYSAYRSLFNKQLNIQLYDIPVELFVETEQSARVSNGIYSVKKNKWIKKPVQEDIPDYDKTALDKLISTWEAKCKKVIDDAKADKLPDEKKVLKLIEEIYEKLRKKGVSKGEYALENLAFKELRNKGYLDKLKEYKNELTSKRLSLEERLDAKMRLDMHHQIQRACGSQPIIQDNGIFYIYNIKENGLTAAVRALRNLSFVTEVSTHANGKYDFSQMAMTNLPTRYYDIRGKISY